MLADIAFERKEEEKKNVYIYIVDEEFVVTS